MRVVLQRVSRAAVRVDGDLVGEIGAGFLALVGIAEGDDSAAVDAMAAKVAGLRVFNDDAGKFNRDLAAVGGAVLVVSQFTLIANLRKGRRPSFVAAARPEVAEPLVERFAERLREAGLPVEGGRFGAHMEVDLLNDGPVTIMIDSSDLESPRRGAHSGESAPGRAYAFHRREQKGRTVADSDADVDPIERTKFGTGSQRRDALLIGAFLAAILAIVGSLGAWVEVGPITINGLDADDGVITIVLAITAAGLIALRLTGNRRVSLLMSSIAFDLIAVAGIVDWADASRVSGAEGLGLEVSVGWGLMLVTVAGIAGAVLSVAAWALDRRADRRAEAREERAAGEG